MGLPYPYPLCGFNPYSGRGGQSDIRSCKHRSLHHLTPFRDPSLAPPGAYRRIQPLLTSHFPLPTSHFSLPTSHFSLLTSHFSLLTSHFPLPTPHFPLPTSHFPLPTSHFPLPTSHFSLPTSHFPLPNPFPNASAVHFARGLPSGGSEGHFPSVQHWKLNPPASSVRLKNLGMAFTGGLTSPARLPSSHFSLLTSHFSLLTSQFPNAFPNASAVLLARGLPSGGSAGTSHFCPFLQPTKNPRQPVGLPGVW
jgi:hypothetical protein